MGLSEVVDQLTVEHSEHWFGHVLRRMVMS